MSGDKIAEAIDEQTVRLVDALTEVNETLKTLIKEWRNR